MSRTCADFCPVGQVLPTAPERVLDHGNRIAIPYSARGTGKEFHIMEVKMTFSLKPVLLAATIGLAAPVAALAGNWDGPYVGAYGSYTNTSLGGIGGQFGYSFAAGSNFYVGPEADFGYYPTPNGWLAQGVVRAGYTLTPDFLGFVVAGVGRSNAAVNYWTVGAGAEYMVTDSLSIRLSGERLKPFSGGTPLYVAKGGIAWHF
jgi:hypothetical protein